MAMTLVTVPVVAVGVCGSDLHRYREGFTVTSLGHELVGSRPGDGALVAIRPLAPCGLCATCRRGHSEQCPQDTSIGRADTGRGGFSGRVRVRPDQLYPLPAGLPAAVAVLADPLACVLHAVRGVELHGAEVLVVGDGPVAALAALHTRHHGARRVTAAVKDPDRTGRMSGFVDAVVTGRDLPADRYHVVLESVGGVSSEPILTAVRAVAPLGEVVALGVYPVRVTADLPVRRLLEKESILRGSKAYRLGQGRDDFAAALELLARRPGDFAPIITSTLTWSPDDPQPPVLEPKRPLKTVYVNALAHPTAPGLEEDST